MGQGTTSINKERKHDQAKINNKKDKHKKALLEFASFVSHEENIKVRHLDDCVLITLLLSHSTTFVQMSRLTFFVQLELKLPRGTAFVSCPCSRPAITTTYTTHTEPTAEPAEPAEGGK